MAKAKDNPITKERDRLIDCLGDMDPVENDYAKVLDRASTLTDISKAEQKQPAIKPDTWLLVGVSLVGLTATLVFEHSGYTITTKTWGAVSKLLSPKI